VRILFFGTAFISKTYLEELCKNNHEIFVVTMPDKPAFRGRMLVAPAVKIYAVENNISFIQTEKFTSEVVEKIKCFNADAGVVVSYGRLIPENVFNLPRYGTFNIHFSLLPKYRGPAPVEFALCSGETETGVTSFYIDKGVDSGSIIVREKIDIDIRDNAETLYRKLIPLGISVMNRTLKFLKGSRYTARPQSGAPSFAPFLKKEDGLADWNKSADVVYNKFRGLYIWPGMYSVFSHGRLAGKRMKFIEIEVFDGGSFNRDSGVVYSIERNKGFTVSCAAGRILVLKLQLENKPVAHAWNFIQGRQLSVGDRFCEKE